MYDQLNNYFDMMLSKYYRGFRKKFRTQHCLLAMIDLINCKAIWLKY